MPSEPSEPKTREPTAEESGSRAEQSVQAFREALEASVTIPRERLQDVVDDAVRRGRMTRGDAEQLVSRLLNRGREQADDILGELESLVAQLRGEVGERTSQQRRNAARTADRTRRELEDATERARAEVGSRAEDARKRAVGAVDQPLASADRARRRARVPGFPISAYDQLSIRQVDRRLADLSRDQLRRVRDYERSHKRRKGLLRALDRKLAGRP
jgi:polyhydroxyalkanoate synthesis regulator phasin